MRAQVGKFGQQLRTDPDAVAKAELPNLRQSAKLTMNNFGRLEQRWLARKK